MNWQDKGYLLSKNKYNENSVISEFYTENHGKISGIIFGGTSKKIKNYLFEGNKLHINYNSKSQSKIGSLKVEIDEFKTPYFLEDKQKLLCIIYTMNLIKILTVENEKNSEIFLLINKYLSFKSISVSEQIIIEVMNHIERTYLSAFEAANTINHLLYENNHNINLSLIRKHYERL